MASGSMDVNPDLVRGIEAMEKRYEEQFASVFDAIGLGSRLFQTGFHFPKSTTPRSMRS